MKLYCVRDVVSQKWLPPWPAENDATALRTFQRSLKDHPFPDDMQLYAVAQWYAEHEVAPLTALSSFEYLPVLAVLFPEEGDAVEEVR